jgi:8-oxo-dGTP diphosphatase
MKDSHNRLALVRKNKPKWQAGRLNGIGGGIDGVETPLDAMCREWYEETGDSYDEWTQFAKIRFPETIVHFFKADVEFLPYLWTANDIGEAIEIHNFATAVRFTDMIPNLKWLLPMAFEDPDAKFALLTPIAVNDNEKPPCDDCSSFDFSCTGLCDTPPA